MVDLNSYYNWACKNNLCNFFFFLIGYLSSHSPACKFKSTLAAINVKYL